MKKILFLLLVIYAAPVLLGDTGPNETIKDLFRSSERVHIHFHPSRPNYIYSVYSAEKYRTKICAIFDNLTYKEESDELAEDLGLDQAVPGADGRVVHIYLFSSDLSKVAEIRVLGRSDILIRKFDERTYKFYTTKSNVKDFDLNKNLGELLESFVPK
jgi:hypothetical protein